MINNKYVIVAVMLLAIMMMAACTPVLPDDINQPSNGAPEQEVPLGSTLTIMTYGAFTMPEYNVQELTITEDQATLEIRHPDGTITAKETITITTQEYNNYIQVFNQNKFMQMDNLYEPKEGDPMVADTGNLEIRVSGQTIEKTVEVIPYADWYMPNELQAINDELIKIKNELYDKAVQNEQTGTPDLVTLKYQPMQCEKTPWQKWYEEGKIQYLKEPTQEELIQDYYSTEHGIQLKSVDEVETDRLVCEACNVCPTANYFEAMAEPRDVSTMADEGWTEA